MDLLESEKKSYYYNQNSMQPYAWLNENIRILGLLTNTSKNAQLAGALKNKYVTRKSYLVTRKGLHG